MAAAMKLYGCKGCSSALVEAVLQMVAVDLYLALSRWSPGRPWLLEHCPTLMASILKTESHPIVKRVWEDNFGV